MPTVMGLSRSIVSVAVISSSQAKQEFGRRDDVLHGLSWIMNEALDQLKPIDDAAKGDA